MKIATALLLLASLFCIHCGGDKPAQDPSSTSTPATSDPAAAAGDAGPTAEPPK